MISGSAHAGVAGKQPRQLARLVVVHGHRHLQAGLAAADRADHLEAAEVRAEQEGAFAAREGGLHQLVPLAAHAQHRVTPAHHVQPVEDGRGEGEHVAEAVARGRFPPQRATQVSARVAARGRCEHEEVAGDDVQDGARQRSAEVERDEDHHHQQRGAAAFRLACPLAGVGARRRRILRRPRRHHASRAATGTSTPRATGCPALSTLKPMEPFGSA